MSEPFNVSVWRLSIPVAYVRVEQNFFLADINVNNYFEDRI